MDKKYFLKSSNDDKDSTLLCTYDVSVGDKVESPIGTGEVIKIKPSVRFPHLTYIIVSIGKGDDDTEAFSKDDNLVYKVIGEATEELLKSIE